jgi:predicted amidohydrolase
MAGRWPTVAGALLVLMLTGCEAPGWIIMTAYDAFAAPQGYTAAAGGQLRAAAVCMESSKDKQPNLDTIARLAAQVMADHPDTDVIVFPELCTSWLYDPADPAAYYQSVAEPIPGASTASVAAVATANAVPIVFGMAEVDAEGRYYNAQVMVKPDGSLVTYRKRGLNQGDVANGCTPGAGPVLAEVAGVPVTFLICSDYQSEAVIRDLSTSTATVVLASLVTSTVLNPRVDFLAKSLSRWVVFANGGGAQGELQFTGHVFTADPTGTVHDPQSGPGHYSWTRIEVAP